MQVKKEKKKKELKPYLIYMFILRYIDTYVIQSINMGKNFYQLQKRKNSAIAI